MHVERIRVQDFGRLHDLDSGPTPLCNLVVIAGPNEAGKSTLFHFLTTLLYGFSPASRDANPYAPWSGAEAAGSVVLRLADGRRWEVHRRLRSTPDGSLVREGVSEELKNRTLPCVEHVPLAIFRQVYAITLGELAGLEGESWARIQDRLVAALGAPDLRPARAVSDELEREAGELWRPNRRGNQRIRQLRERLRELVSRRREVASADLTLRDEARELERTQAALADARAEREECRMYVERYGALLQVRASLARVRALEEEAGPRKALEALPTDPAAWLAERANQLRAQEARVEELTHDADASRRHIEALEVTDTRVLERAREIERVAASVQVSGWTRARAGQLQIEMRELQSLAEAEATELFEAPWDRIEARPGASAPPGRPEGPGARARGRTRADRSEARGRARARPSSRAGGGPSQAGGGRSRGGGPRADPGVRGVRRRPRRAPAHGCAGARGWLGRAGHGDPSHSLAVSDAVPGVRSSEGAGGRSPPRPSGSVRRAIGAGSTGGALALPARGRRGAAAARPPEPSGARGRAGGPPAPGCGAGRGGRRSGRRLRRVGPPPIRPLPHISCLPPRRTPTGAGQRRVVRGRR